MSKHHRTAMVCGKPSTAPEGDYYVVCSFDQNHVILRSRMPYHIIKCIKNHPNHNKKQCPYDATEYIDENEFNLHILTCESKRSICTEKFETAELKKKGVLCNIKPTPFFHTYAPELDEDWGAPESENDEKDTPLPESEEDDNVISPLPESEEDDDNISVLSVGRGHKYRSKQEPPKKGMGRAQILDLIWKRYNEKMAGSSSSSSVSSKIISQGASLKIHIPGQFDDN